MNPWPHARALMAKPSQVPKAREPPDALGASPPRAWRGAVQARGQTGEAQHTQSPLTRGSQSRLLCQSTTAAGGSFQPARDQGLQSPCSACNSPGKSSHVNPKVCAQRETPAPGASWPSCAHLASQQCQAWGSQCQPQPAIRGWGPMRLLRHAHHCMAGVTKASLGPKFAICDNIS